jgi:hypothetical protein
MLTTKQWILVKKFSYDINFNLNSGTVGVNSFSYSLGSYDGTLFFSGNFPYTKLTLAENC